MKKSKILSLFVFLGSATMLFAQTLAERQAIISHYDLEKLSRMESDYAAEFAYEKQIALDLAAINGWEEIIEMPNGGIAILVGVFENGNPKYLMTHNREGGITTRTDKVHTGGGAGLNLNGEDMVIGEWDGGRVRATHPLLQNRVTQVDNPASFSDHSTHVAGTMIGTGTVAGGAAKGMAPVGEILAWDFNNDNSEMVGAAAAGMLVSNHSYGYNIGGVDLWQLGYYDSNSKSVDNICYNTPYYLPVFSAGNDRQSGVNPGDGGYDYLTGRGVAKNNLVSAAVFEVLNYTGPNSVTMSSFSCWGPTDDGRIKPDIAAKGVAMYSSVSASSYANYNGTSMSAPNTTGSLAVLQQHYNDINNAFMLGSTLRGLVLHTADEAGTTLGPDYRFGWGLMNTERAAQVISNNGTASVMIEEELSNGDVYTMSLQADGVNPLVASVTWTDPSGTLLPSGVNDNATPMLVNDLDIRISDDGGTTFLPWKLDPSNFSAAATNGDNKVDNIEKIEIPGASGEYIIQISHKNNALTNDGQVFSFIASGIDKEAFTVSSHQGIKEACASDGSATFNIDLGFNAGFSDTVNFTVSDLPAGTTGNVAPTSLNSEGTVVLTVNGIGSLSPGDYQIKVTGTGTSETVNVYVTLRILGNTVPAIGLTYPADEAIDLPVVINFTWEVGDETVDNYDFELARDAAFTNIEFSENVILPHVLILGVTEGAEYFWRVKPNTICADGVFSEVWSFTVAGVLGINDQTIEGLVVYPNPAQDILNVEAASSISTIEIINILGQVMISEKTTSNNVQLNISKLSSGTYFARITAEDSTSIVQIIKR